MTSDKIIDISLIVGCSIVGIALICILGWAFLEFPGGGNPNGVCEKKCFPNPISRSYRMKTGCVCDLSKEIR